MSGMTILMSPLNWGFGHAGRMIPLALELKRRGHRVIFGADPHLVRLIENELPGIRLIDIPGLRIRYSRWLPQYLSIFLQLPLVVFHAVREHFILRHLAQQYKPSVIISDNRFGFFHRKIFSVYVTHQVRIPFPRPLRFMEPVAAWLHRIIIPRYDLCLVPDYPGVVNLSGRLSHDLKPSGNIHYMGPLSRFRVPAPSGDNITLLHPCCCLILSGPEPQHSLLYEKVRAALCGMNLYVLSATPVRRARDTDPGITFLIKPDTGTMRHIITGSTLIITRAGYTSVMELSSLGRGAVLIPTPGQPEQEYLGDYLNGRHGFITLNQKNITGLRSLAERLMAGTGLTETHSLQVTDNTAPSLPDNGSPLLNSAGQLPGSGLPAMNPTGPLPDIASPELPDSATLFEKATDLLLEQNNQ